MSRAQNVPKPTMSIRKDRLVAFLATELCELEPRRSEDAYKEVLERMNASVFKSACASMLAFLTPAQKLQVRSNIEKALEKDALAMERLQKAMDQGENAGGVQIGGSAGGVAAPLTPADLFVLADTALLNQSVTTPTNANLTITTPTNANLSITGGAVVGQGQGPDHGYTGQRTFFVDRVLSS